MTFDPLADERLANGGVIPRGPDDRPWIVPRGGTEPELYTRASQLADFLVKNKKGIHQWEKRYLAQGIAKNPDLAMRAAAVHYSTGPISGTLPISDRKVAGAELDEVIELAEIKAGRDEAANMGTAGHTLTVPGCAGVALDGLVDTVKGYNEVTAGLTRVASEVFVACDEIKASGTFDSIYASPEFPGMFVVGDTKTGKNYHQAQFELQLAVYAHGEVYLGRPTWDGLSDESVEHQRLTFEEYLGLPVNLQVAYLVHVSVTGSPKPRIVKLDLERGWHYAQQAAQKRDAMEEFDKIGIGEKVDHEALAWKVLDREIVELVKGPPDHEAAAALYKRFRHIWGPEETLVIKRWLA